MLPWKPTQTSPMQSIVHEPRQQDGPYWQLAPESPHAVPGFGRGEGHSGVAGVQNQLPPNAWFWPAPQAQRQTHVPSG
jgi:hypothetical protein